jgi:bacterioferritin (cytochrome b1)
MYLRYAQANAFHARLLVAATFRKVEQTRARRAIMVQHADQIVSRIDQFDRPPTLPQFVAQVRIMPRRRIDKR